MAEIVRYPAIYKDFLCWWSFAHILRTGFSQPQSCANFAASQRPATKRGYICEPLWAQAERVAIPHDTCFTVFYLPKLLGMLTNAERVD